MMVFTLNWEGQGYIWANHRNPTSKSWGLARYSMLLWEQLVADLERSGTDAFSSIGWQNTGLAKSYTPNPNCLKNVKLSETPHQYHILECTHKVVAQKRTFVLELFLNR